MIIDLKDHRDQLKKLAEIRNIDVRASYVILDECLNMLNINNLPELDTIKDQIKVAIKKLENLHG